MVGLKYFRGGFFQDTCRTIRAAVMEYAGLRARSEVDPAEIVSRRGQVEELVARMIVDSGLRAQRECYLSVDREFFLDSGGLDMARLDNFTRAVLTGYALEDLKWTFAGTTSCLSPIACRTLESAGRAVEDMLPQELRRARWDDLQRRRRSPRPNTDTLFVYPDGRVLRSYVPRAARMSYADLRDRTGFDWRSGFGAGDGIPRGDWLAGFNERGEWERIDYDCVFPLVEWLPIDDLLRYFIGGLSTGADEVYVISVPATGEALLFDTRSRLMRDEERRFYSVTGDLYAVRSVDRRASLDSVKADLDRLGVTTLTGIVIGEDSDESRSFYRDAFAERLTPSTNVWWHADRRVAETLGRLREEIEESDISSAVSTQLLRLAREGRTLREVYEGLAPSTVRPSYDIELNLFANPRDLELFRTLPEVQGLIDDESAKLLGSLVVPPERREALSNAVQNLLMSYEHVLRGNDVTPADVIRHAQQVLVEGRTEDAARVTVTGARTLQAIVKDLLQARPRVEIPTFRALFPESGDYFDIFDEAGFASWAESLHGREIPRRLLPGIRKIITEAGVVESAKKTFSCGLQRVMALFSEITRSTKLDAQEIVETFTEIFLRGSSRKAAQANVYISRSLDALIREAAAGNANPVRRSIVDVYGSPSYVEPAFDLMNDVDARIFRQSTAYRDLGLSESEGDDLFQALASAHVPVSCAPRLTHGVRRLLAVHASDLRARGVTLSRAVEAMVLVLNGRGQDLSPELARIARDSVGEPDAETEPGGKTEPGRVLNLFNEKERAELMAAPELRGLTLEEGRLVAILDQHRASYRDAGRRHVRRLPLRFQSTGQGDDFPLAVDAPTAKHRIQDVGWVVDYHAGRPQAIEYTELGLQILPPEVRQEIGRLIQLSVAEGKTTGTAPTAGVTRTEELLVGQQPRAPGTSLPFVSDVTVVQLEAALQSPQVSGDLELAHPFSAIRQRIDEARGQMAGRLSAGGPSAGRPSARAASPTLVAPENGRQGDASRRPPQSARMRAPAVAEDGRHRPAPGEDAVHTPSAAATERQTIEEHYRQEKAKLEAATESAAGDRGAAEHQDGVRHAADELFARVVSALESPPVGGTPQPADPLFEKFVKRLGGKL